MYLKYDQEQKSKSKDNLDKLFEKYDKLSEDKYSVE